MKKLIAATLVATAAAFTAGITLTTAAHATTAEQKAAAKDKWESMTPEEKAAFKEKGKAKWESMTPEEQAAAKKRFAEKHPRAADKMADKKKEEAAAK